jgi:aldehyde dehydrogenase (NAD+)
VAELVPKYFQDNTVVVINGAVEETTELLKHPFDKLFYTGGGRVAKVILRAAAEHLTPVVLELGGKSPCYVDENLDDGAMHTAARRIVWGRFSNAGQTCIAPDYILCPPTATARLVKEMKTAIQAFYTQNPKESDSYGRIINVARHRHLMGLLNGMENVVTANPDVVADEQDLFIPPTILTGVKQEDAIMKEEVRPCHWGGQEPTSLRLLRGVAGRIFKAMSVHYHLVSLIFLVCVRSCTFSPPSQIFGPLLPIMEVKNVAEAVAYVNANDKPLALYVFSNDQKVCDTFINSTSSGSALQNDCLMQGKW